jgi:hypothetical protein
MARWEMAATSNFAGEGAARLAAAFTNGASHKRHGGHQ